MTGQSEDCPIAGEWVIEQVTKYTVHGLHSTSPEVMSMLCSVAGNEEMLIMAISS